MTDDKYEVVRRKLEQLLRQHHFHWVVEAVEEQSRPLILALLRHGAMRAHIAFSGISNPFVTES